jgi:hypothetical protein
LKSPTHQGRSSADPNAAWMGEWDIRRHTIRLPKPSGLLLSLSSGKSFAYPAGYKLHALSLPIAPLHPKVSAASKLGAPRRYSARFREPGVSATSTAPRSGTSRPLEESSLSGSNSCVHLGSPIGVLAPGTSEGRLLRGHDLRLPWDRCRIAKRLPSRSKREQWPRPRTNHNCPTSCAIIIFLDAAPASDSGRIAINR